MVSAAVMPNSVAKAGIRPRRPSASIPGSIFVARSMASRARCVAASGAFQADHAVLPPAETVEMDARRHQAPQPRRVAVDVDDQVDRRADAGAGLLRQG